MIRWLEGSITSLGGYKKSSGLGAGYDDAAERSYLDLHFATFREVYRTAAAQGAGIDIDAC